MIVKPFSAKFSNIGGQISSRCDPKYRHFWDNEDGTPIHQTRFDSEKIKYILLPFSRTVIKKGDLEDERILLDLDDVEAITSILLQERKTMEIGSNKLDFKDCDFVICKLRPYLGKIVINDVSKKYIGTTEWLPLKVNSTKINRLFLKYLLLMPEFLHAYNFLLSGKQHPRMDEIDFRNIRLPLPPLAQQVEIRNELTQIEKRINLLHSGLDKPIDIINKVFAERFGYDIHQFEKKSEINNYQLSFSELSDSLLLRSSANFHHVKYDYVREILMKHQWVKLKTLCKQNEEIHRGVQPIYDEDGGIHVIKTANIKNEFIDFTDAQTVNEKFYDENEIDAGVKNNDIVVTCTGVGSTGKVDLYMSEEKALADSHVAIIRLDEEKVDPLYGAYYLRSIIGKAQIEREPSGSTNQIEIYPEQLEQIRVICPSKTEQRKLINEVKIKLDKLLFQKKEIERLRDKIDAEITKLLR